MKNTYQYIYSILQANPDRRFTVEVVFLRKLERPSHQVKKGIRLPCKSTLQSLTDAGIWYNNINKNISWNSSHVQKFNICLRQSNNQLEKSLMMFAGSK